MSKDDSKKQADHQLLSEARTRRTMSQSKWSTNFERAKKDLKMLDGNQWDQEAKTAREEDGRPCLVSNVLPTFVDVVTGEQRQNRAVGKVIQTGFKSTANEVQRQGINSAKIEGKKYTHAQALTGLLRQVEHISDVETTFDRLSQYAAQSGFGWCRIRTDYVSEQSFDQYPLVDFIRNQFSVHMDSSGDGYLYEDANWCLIDTSMSRSIFDAKYPGVSADTSGLSNATGLSSDKEVVVSEYYTRELYHKKIYLLSNGHVIDEDKYKKISDELQEKGVTVERERLAECYRVYWRKICATAVLEGPVEVATTTIPVVPCLGKELQIENKTLYRGIIRHALDDQVMANYFNSTATEMVGMSPKTPWVGAHEHFESNKSEWKTVNSKPLAYIGYKPLYREDRGPRREQPPQVPAAEIALSMNASEKIKATIGLYDASLGNNSREVSGRAIIARENQGNRGTFEFSDNLSKCRKRVTQLIVELLVNTYDTERTEKIRFDDGSEDEIILNTSVFDDESGEYITINDFSVADYDIDITTGPSFASQRQEAADSMLRFSQAVPDAATAVSDLIADNLDFPGAATMKDRLKRRIYQINPQVLNKNERQEIEKDLQDVEQPPNPEMELKQLELQIEQLKLQGEEIKAQADIAKAQADAQKASVDTAENVRDIMAQALSEFAYVYGLEPINQLPTEPPPEQTIDNE